ncbi:MAG TPA: response regulator, partial [Pseudorhodoferax sp.]|nr:response regulator [Pseudorhodoferax sp.]
MRILVVDDLELNRDLLVRRVRRLGHEAGVAVNGRDALEQLRRGDWDLVLLDITMPEMDGYDALRQIRADPSPSGWTATFRMTIALPSAMPCWHG